MRSLYDSTDFASDVMKSLAANAGRLDFPSFDSLVAFLVQVAEKKVIDEYRKVHALKRDIDRQRGLVADDGEGGRPGGRRGGNDRSGRRPEASPDPAACGRGNDPV